MCRPIETKLHAATGENRRDQPTEMSTPIGNAAVKNHPVTLDEFYTQNPSFIWGPALFAGLLYGATTHVPMVVNFLESRKMEAFGWTAAWQYSLCSIVASYAFHGFCATHAPHKLKIQAQKAYEVKPDAMATRSTAALVTELVYTFMPLAPATNSWLEFAAWTVALAVYWDMHFFFMHRYCHENKNAYRFFHKIHHLCKEPNCFGAYFVTYQSHVALEQVVVLIMALLGLPRNVFLVSLYWGTIGTFVEHSGYELGTMKLPLLPITFGQLSSAMGFFSGILFEGVSVAEHDWHHERFFDNYALSFTYLDKLFGTHHPGREPGTGKVKASSE